MTRNLSRELSTKLNRLQTTLLELRERRKRLRLLATKLLLASAVSLRSSVLLCSNKFVSNVVCFFLNGDCFVDIHLLNAVDS